MPEIMVRIEMTSYESWLDVHYEFTEERAKYGMTDGPVYRDIDNPNAALFHIHADDIERAMKWFQTDTFREATRRATVTGRELFVAEQRGRP